VALFGWLRKLGTRREAARPPKIVVWHADDPAWLVRRSVRFLQEHGLPASSSPLHDLAQAIAGERIVWLLRAGTVLHSPAVFRFGRSSPSILIGPPLDETGTPAGAWRDVFERQAGVLGPTVPEHLPEPAIVAVGQSDALAGHLATASGLMDAILKCAATHALIPASGLGARRDLRPRIAICISSLHVGGAEKVAADLARLLPANGIAARLFILERPQREALDAGPHAFLAYEGATHGRDRLHRLRQELHAWSADALSLHLLPSTLLHALAGLDRPCLLTLHNDRQGWPPGYAAAAQQMRLVIGCSVGVSQQARADGLQPVRTAWNGVEERQAVEPVASITRESLGIPSGALVVLSIANERPQKRLDKVAPIVAELRREGFDAHAIIAGHRAAAGDTPDFVHRVGPVEDIGALMRLADVYLTTSDYEGLSLSQIEAARAGLPIVATRTNGAAELQSRFTHCRFVDPCATPEVFAAEILSLHAAGRAKPAAARDAFSATSMSRRYASLVRRTLAHDTRAKDGVLFVCNDFAVGGAQSSLSRLMDELRRRAVPCAAFLVGETQERPSPGTQRLQRAGHALVAMPSLIQRDLRALAEHACAFADRGRYASIVYWNAITEMKVRISDLAIGYRIFDVSPGEMYFRSLHRYFAAPAQNLPFLSALDYGGVLDGVVVKYAREVAIAAEALGRPVHVIANGVPKRPAVAHPEKSRLAIGTLCRIAPDKKLEQLLDAVRHLRPHHASFELLVGGAPDIGQERYAAELMRSAADLPVRWVGQVDADTFLPGLDAFALVAEPAGCPNASLEAMAHGLAVIATDVGGMSDQVVDGVSGYLAARGDSRDLARALERLLDAPQRRVEMGEEGRRRAQDVFSLDRMTRGYMQLLGLPCDPS
jgi:glycosyltransferase involved in cell wall biosynthesis